MSSQDTVSSVVAQFEPRPAQPDRGARKLLSVVIPCYNESANIEPLFARLFPVLDTLPMDWEVVCVNDGSSDDTLDRLVAVHARSRACGWSICRATSARRRRCPPASPRPRATP